MSNFPTKPKVWDMQKIWDMQSDPGFKLLGINCVCGAKTEFSARDGDDNEITCPSCHRIFRITSTGSAKSAEDLAREALGALEMWIDMLNRAPRQGGPSDQPEGMRYITLSDTLAVQLTDSLRKARDTALKALDEVGR